jgi:SulP family sulfate permease
MSKVPYIDQSGLFALEDVIMELSQKGIKTLVVGVQSQPLYLMKSIGIVNTLVPAEQVFDTFKEAQQWVIQQNGTL